MNIQNLDMIAGETRSFTLNARDPGNLPKNLNGLSVTWRIGRGPADPNSDYPLITKTGTITAAAAGTFTVSLAGADTIDMLGDYTHQAASSDGVVVVAGKLHIRPAIARG